VRGRDSDHPADLDAVDQHVVVAGDGGEVQRDRAVGVGDAGEGRGDGDARARVQHVRAFADVPVAERHLPVDGHVDEALQLPVGGVGEVEAHRVGRAGGQAGDLVREVPAVAVGLVDPLRGRVADATGVDRVRRRVGNAVPAEALVGRVVSGRAAAGVDGDAL